MTSNLSCSLPIKVSKFFNSVGSVIFTLFDSNIAILFAITSLSASNTTNCCVIANSLLRASFLALSLDNSVFSSPNVA